MLLTHLGRESTLRSQADWLPARLTLSSMKLSGSLREWSAISSSLNLSCATPVMNSSSSVPLGNDDISGLKTADFPLLEKAN